jgi:hypothetical protein
MESNPLDCGLCAHESTAFAHACHLHGFHPEQFQVSVAEAVDYVGSIIVLERIFVVTQISSGCRRRYRVDHFAGGLEAFESDLRAGVFPWGFVDWDWISAHHCS